MIRNPISFFVAIGIATVTVGCDGGNGGGDSGSGGDGTTSGNPTAGPASGSATGPASGAGGSAAGIELVNIEGWVGGDPESHDDDPLGIQGAWYGYGDGSSCAEQMGLNPCESGKCCISGTTAVDMTFAKWGCGIGLSLNATGGETAVKSPFVGTASSFKAVIEGDSGGNLIRIGITQDADTEGKVAPFVELAGPAAQAFSFADAKYPAWCMGNAACDGLQGTPADPAKAYDIQVQVVGGNIDAPYNICITSLQAF